MKYTFYVQFNVPINHKVFDIIKEMEFSSIYKQ